MERHHVLTSTGATAAVHTKPRGPLLREGPSREIETKEVWQLANGEEPGAGGPVSGKERAGQGWWDCEAAAATMGAGGRRP